MPILETEAHAFCLLFLFLSVMIRLKLFILLISTLISFSLMAAQQEVKALTVEQMEAAASQAYLQQILSIDSLEDAEDCKRHRQDALMCSNFILNTPCELNEKSDLMWIYCARFVLLWDEKSDEILISFPKSSKDWMICPEIMSVFLAAFTKFGRSVRGLWKALLINACKALRFKVLPSLLIPYLVTSSIFIIRS